LQRRLWPNGRGRPEVPGEPGVIWTTGKVLQPHSDCSSPPPPGPCWAPSPAPPSQDMQSYVSGQCSGGQFSAGDPVRTQDCPPMAEGCPQGVACYSWIPTLPCKLPQSLSLKWGHSIFLSWVLLHEGSRLRILAQVPGPFCLLPNCLRALDRVGASRTESCVRSVLLLTC
jgi:hypothetical protein